MASVHLDQTSEQLYQSHQAVAKATDGISGTLTLTTSAINKTTEQNAAVASGLATTIDALGDLKSSLTTISDNVRSGSENANNAASMLARNHQQYRQEMESAISELHDKLGELLQDYSKTVQNQTSHRMEEWNRHTQEFVNGMTGVVEVMQDLVDEMETRNRSSR